MDYTKKTLPLLLALTPFTMYSQAQSGAQTEQKNAMTDSVYKIKEVVVRSNQMLGSKFEALVLLIIFLPKNLENLVTPISTVC